MANKDGVFSDGKAPGFWWYPADFELDVAGISLGATGLWSRMLGWMHLNEAHRGFLELPNGEPMTEAQIALRAGRSLREIRPLIRELENFAVFSRTPAGAVYCRRMARETHISSVRSAAAKSRADKAHRAVDGTFANASFGALDGDLHQQNSQHEKGKKPTVPASASVSVSGSINTDTCASGDARMGAQQELSIDAPPFDAPELSATSPASESRAGRSSLRDQQDAWFAEWWAGYWLKKARKAARDAFGKHVKDVARFEQVMAALKSQAPEMLKREPRHRPQGATWINGERWNDEAVSGAGRVDAVADAVRQMYSELQEKQD